MWRRVLAISAFGDLLVLGRKTGKVIQGQRTKLQGLKKACSEEPLNSKSKKNLPRKDLNQEIRYFPLIQFWDRELLAGEIFYHRNQLSCVVGMLPPSSSSASKTQ